MKSFDGTTDDHRALFPDFLGNESAKKLLASFALGRDLPHAVLLEGLPGSGRRTLAGILAAAAVCTCSAGPRPCGACRNCRKASHGTHPDIVTADASVKPLSMDAVRTLRSTLYLLPNEAAFRVLILIEAGDMSELVQNALLKMLEEPPAHQLILMTCRSRSAILPTVLSRTLTVPVAGVGAELAMPLLRRRFPDAAPEELTQALLIFDGRIGAVTEAFSDAAFTRTQELAAGLALALAEGPEWALAAATAPLAQQKELLDAVLASLRLILRNGLLLQNGIEPPLRTQSPDANAARSLAGARTPEQLAAGLEVVDRLAEDRRRHMSDQLFLSILAIRLWQAVTEN